MKIIIAGPRDCKDEKLIEEAILKGIEEIGEPTEILHGGATGVDSIAADICKKMGYSVVKYPAKWKNVKGKPKEEIGENGYGKYWKLAGFDRNQQMAKEADALIAISLGTAGTDDMLRRARKEGLKIYEYRPESLEENCFGFNFWDE